MLDYITLPNPSSRHLTKPDFMDRFPPGVWRQLKALANSDADIDQMLDWFTHQPQDVDGTAINLDSPRLIAALAKLIAKGRLTQAEADFIRS